MENRKVFISIIELAFIISCVDFCNSEYGELYPEGYLESISKKLKKMRDWEERKDEMQWYCNL